MVLQLFVSAVYQTVRHSWFVAAVMVKYLVAAQLLYAFRAGDFSVENFEEVLERYSRETVAGLVALGLVFYAVRFEPEPLLPFFSQLVALAYFGYLFWKF